MTAEVPLVVGAPADGVEASPEVSRTATVLGWVRRHAPVLTVGVELALAAAFLIYQSTRLWFSADDWDFLIHRDLSHDTLRRLFAPHGGHWSTLPILSYRALFHIVGLRSYLPYALVDIALHIAVCILLWFLLRRAGLGSWITAGVVGVMAFLGAGAENLLWDFQVGFVGAVAFGLVALLIVDRDTPRFGRRDAWAWVAAIASLMCSAVGLAMLVTLGLFVWLRRGLRTALAITSVPLAAYLVWYVAIGHEHGSMVHHAGQYLQIPAYMWTGLTAVWEQVSGLPNSGAVILAVLVVPLLFSRTRDRLATLAIAGIGGAVALFLVIGFARVGLGLDQAKSSRYIYVAAALTIPAVAWLVQSIAQRAQGRAHVAAAAFALLVALFIVNGIQLAVSFADKRVQNLAGRKDRLIAAEQLVRSGDRTLGGLVDTIPGPTLSVTNLKNHTIQAAIPSKPVTRQGLLDASAFLQVGVSRTPIPGVPPAEAVRWNGISGRPSFVGCEIGTVTSASPTITVQLGSGGGMIQMAAGTPRINVALIRDGLISVANQPKVWPTVPYYIASVARDAQLRVTFRAPGRVGVCTGP
jgi:hypothetical protein